MTTSTKGSVAATVALCVLMAAGCSGSGSDGKGGRYGLGRVATAKEVAAVDVDAGPDGAGLPPGRGTAAEGAALYAAKCANCHGPKGEGMPPAYPALVGRPAAGETFAFADDPKIPKTIGNYWPNAISLFDYLRRAMPHNAPGSLENAQLYALTAHLLAENGVLPATATLDSAALSQVRMPAEKRFVADDRRGGATVR